ncbi:MAG: ribosome silencing factor [Deltaproteobacteria bacterium]|nr:ribosome silencing factor [Deltaproteobacteria bacterium]
MAAHLLGEKLGEDIVIINIKELSSVTDYVVIAGATSDRQIRTLSKGVQDGFITATTKNGEELEKVKPLSVEGERTGAWVLLDYGDVVIHIFIKSERERYDLEGLWADAPRVEFDESKAGDTDTVDGNEASAPSN